MTEPNRADAARRFLGRLGVRIQPPARTPSRGTVEDDDYDIEIGSAQMEPPDVEIGSASMLPDDEVVASRPDTVVPEIRIEGDARRASPRLGSMLSVLPEALSERVGRAIDDDSSALGEYLRTMADVGDRTGVPDLYDNETLARMEALGRAGVDAIPFGWGDEIAERQQRQAAAQARMLGASSPFEPRRLGDMETTDRRGLDVPDESDFDRERRRVRRLRAEHPTSSTVGTVIGAIPSAVLTPGATAATPGARILQGAGINALSGAVTGAGLSDDDEWVGSEDDGEIIGGRLGDAAESAITGGVLGGTFQALGEGVGAGARWLRQLRMAADNPGPVLEPLGDAAAQSAQLSDGPQTADTIRRFTRTGTANAPEPSMPEGATAGQFADDEHVVGPLRTVDDPGPPRAGGRPGAIVPDDIPPDPADIALGDRQTWEQQMRAEQARDPAAFDAALEADRVRRARAGGYTGEEPESAIQARLGERARAEARAARASDEGAGTPRPTRRRRVSAERLADPADVTMLEDEVVASPRALPDDADEFLGPVADRARRQPPAMPESGPELRAAAMRGERSFGARGERGADPTIEAADELSAMARDYAEIESGAGGFQPLKDARIRQAMSVEPPPAGWQDRARSMIDTVERDMEAITRHAGADPRLSRAAGEARLTLERARDALTRADEFGEPVDPAEVYRLLNRANMSIGRAAAAESRQSGMGMQHTTAFSEPLTGSYQRMRAYLADPAAWGTEAARVQREMNQAVAPLMRSSRALRDRAGALFQDSGEQVAGGGGFRTYETVRPEAVRGIMGRANDDAYAGERELLRAWVENYGEQGATLARLSEDPALAPQARAMQERAQRLLDLLDRAEVEGRAAQMLQGIADVRPGGQRMPSVGQMVRMVSRIENGELRAPEMTSAMRALEALEGRIMPAGAPGVGSAVAGRDEAPMTPSAPAMPREEPQTPRWMRERDEGQDAGVAPQIDEEDDQLPRWQRDLR